MIQQNFLVPTVRVVGDGTARAKMNVVEPSPTNSSKTQRRDKR